MVGAGLISYSAYLWHQPVFAFARVSLDQAPPAWMMGALIVLILGLAWLSWAFVEQPFRGKRFSTRQITLGLGTALALAISFGGAGHLTTGFAAQRFTDATVQAFDSARPSPMRDACHNQPARTACSYSGTAPAKYAVFGDSHGVELAFGLSELVKAQGDSVLHLTRAGCPPALSFETRAVCNRWTDASLAHLETLDGLAAILVTYRHASYLYGRNEATYPVLPDRPRLIYSGDTAAEKRALYWASFEDLIARLRAAGHTLVLLQPVPEMGRHIDEVIMAAAPTKTPQNPTTADPLIGIDRAYYRDRTRDVNSRLLAMAQADPEIHLLDPTQAFCDADHCYATADGQALYFDDNHPSVSGATKILQRGAFREIVNTSAPKASSLLID